MSAYLIPSSTQFAAWCGSRAVLRRVSGVSRMRKTPAQFHSFAPFLPFWRKGRVCRPVVSSLLTGRGFPPRSFLEVEG